MTEQLDIIAFGAHPDDVELSCGGTIAKGVSGGKKIGIIDLTRGELATRGSADLRAKRQDKHPYWVYRLGRIWVSVMDFSKTMSSTN